LILLIQYNLFITFYLACFTAFFSVAHFGFVQWPSIMGMALLTWQIYSLDRWIQYPEDQGSLALPWRSLRLQFSQRKKMAGFLALSVIVELLVIYFYSSTWKGFLVGNLLGLSYLIEIPLFRKRIKMIPFLKAFYIPFTILVTLFTFLEVWPRSISEWKLVFFSYLLCFFNVIIFDLKDRKQDQENKITTFANFFSKKGLIVGVQIACLLCFISQYFFETDPVLKSLGMTFLLFFILILGCFFRTGPRYYFIVLDSINAFPLLFLKFLK